MLVKTALLVVTNPKQIGKILPSVQKQVKNTLYIQLLSALTEPFGNFHASHFNSWPKYSQTVYGIYSQAVTHCRNLDVRVLISGLKYQIAKIQTSKDIDLIIFDRSHSQADIDDFIKGKVGSVASGYNVLTLDSGKFEGFEDQSEDGRIGEHSVLGGTFDRLHVAHKLLLTEAVLRSTSAITVGVTEENMLHGKTLWELIEDVKIRIANVKDFLTDICSELSLDVVPISDPFGPAITDPTMDLIVVSEETVRGGEKINEIREANDLSKLDIVPINLIDEPHPSPIEETKISSSTARIRLLGTLLRPVTPNPNIPERPYVVGLTGGVASGKSGVAKWLSQLGAEIVICDTVAHQAYEPGKPCHRAIVEYFGESVVAPDGKIDRKTLGAIVFKNPEQLQTLNRLVWPAVAEEVAQILKRTKNRVVVVEAAILLQAGWEKMCHEVWTTLVPREEALSRLKKRNSLPEDQANARIDAQPPNTTYVNGANVVFCPLWAEEYTKQQVETAWDLLQARLL